MILLSSLLLAACDSLVVPRDAWPANVPPRNPAIAEQPITLRVWLAKDYIDTEPIQALIADFERAYPNITIETRNDLVWEDMRRSVDLAISQGNPPDVAHGHAFAFGAQGLAEPVDDLWAHWNAENEFMPGAMEDVIWKDHYYGVPLDINALFTIYNKRLFEAAGVAAPDAEWTFEDFEDAARKLTTGDGSQFATALSTSGWVMAGLIFANGGKLLEEQDGKIVAMVDESVVADMLALHRRLGIEEQFATLPPPIERQSDHPVALFGTGRIAMFFSGPWDLARLRAEAPAMMEDVGTAPLPRGPGADAGGSVQGGGSLFVPRGAQHREAAFEFMKWAVAEPYALRLALELGRYPVKSEYYSRPELQADPLLAPFYEQLKTARPYKLEAYLRANDTWEATVRDALAPQADLAALLRDAQAKIQREIDETEAAATNDE